MITQPITKAKYIINIVKSVGKDIDYALDIVAWYTMTDDEEEQVKQSEQCFRCGNSHTDFRDENETDKIPMGSTLQGIIAE